MVDVVEPSVIADEGERVALHPIRPVDFSAVGLFLHQNLNPRISPQRWASMIAPTWKIEAPNHGFLLRNSGGIVGVQLAFYSVRQRLNAPRNLCNLAAFCVLPQYRVHSLRLLRAVLSQPGYSFTDLSPSGNVRPLNLRLGFRQLDTTTALVPNIASLFATGRMQLISDPFRIASRLAGADLGIFRDHRDAQAAEHVLIVDGDRYCYVIFRRDRRKNLPLFATLLYVSDPTLFRKGRKQFFRYLLVRRGIPFTLMELRLVGDRPRLSVLLREHRPKMFRSTQLDPDAVDYLYSELTCVSW